MYPPDCIHIVPCAWSCKTNGDARPYTFMPMPGLATSCTRYECVWACITIYLARPYTGHNVYGGNDYAPAFNLLD